MDKFMYTAVLQDSSVIRADSKDELDKKLNGLNPVVAYHFEEKDQGDIREMKDSLRLVIDSPSDINSVIEFICKTEKKTVSEIKKLL